MGATAFGRVLSACHAHDKRLERQKPPVWQPNPFVVSPVLGAAPLHTLYLAVRCVQGCRLKSLMHAEDDQEVVDGWDPIQRPSVWHLGASTMSAAPGSQLFVPPFPSR